MNSLPKRQVLVLLMCVAFTTIFWVSGCAGVAEPLPSLTVGATSSQVVSVTNVGTTNVSVNQAVVNGTGFTVTGLTTPMMLPVGQSKSFTVKFAAAAVGSVNGSVTIVADPPHRPVVLSLHGNGSTANPNVTSVTVSPATASIALGANVQFTAAVQGSTTNDAVTWTASMGSITSAGVYTAPVTSATVTVTATSVADPTKSASGVVTVAGSTTPPVSSVTVSPATTSSTTGSTVSFTATVQGPTLNKGVTWQASTGSVTSSGVYTAPAGAGTSTVTATSLADPTKSGVATITVTAVPTVTSVTISPLTATSITKGTLPFSATVQGTTSNKAVSWKALLGTITSSGAYTAPAKAGIDTVTATSVADTTKLGSANVTVTAPVTPPVVTSVSVSPASTSTTTTGSLQFTATVQGTVSDKSVTWSASLGSINSSGSYTAPAKAGTDMVTATSNADATKSASATVAITLSHTASCGGSGCPAFPEAQGGGAAAVGGRGGQVIEVTNLNDSGTGTLRACIDASGPRTCVFRVSGLITFLSRAQVWNPYLTIAGQTAPGGGIVIGGPNQSGEQIFVSTHDVIFRYLTWDGSRPGPTGPQAGTVGFEMASGDIYNVIWDHCEVRWAGNKGFGAVSNQPGIGIHNITVQWNLLYEPNVAHAVGIGTVYVSDSGSGIGSGMKTTDNDAHHNMFITVDHRLPLNQSGRNVRWVNNLIYNWGQFAALSMGGVQTDYIGNKYVDGNGGNLNYSSVHVFLANGNGCDGFDNTGDCPNGDNELNPTMYLLNNVGHIGTTMGGALVSATNSPNDSGQRSMTSQGGEGGENWDPNAVGPWPERWYRNTPLPTEQFPITADPVENLDTVLLPTVGNSQHLDCNGDYVINRDSEAARAILVYQNRAADDLFSGQHAAPAISSGTACQETFHDGIADQWKTKHGLSTSDASLGSRTAPNGYTYLENYLNGTDPTR
jgi:hypothetical protein